MGFLPSTLLKALRNIRGDRSLNSKRSKIDWWRYGAGYATRYSRPEVPHLPWTRRTLGSLVKTERAESFGEILYAVS